MATNFSLPIPYRLKAVRIGLQATWLALGALIAYPFLPQAPAVNVVPFLVLVGVAGAGAALIQLLPWRSLFEKGLGLRFQYAWSVFDILLISALIAVSGGGASALVLLYVLTSVFFATSYSPTVQFVMLMITYVSYVTAVGLTGWEGDTATLVMRLIILGVITTMTSFLSGELAAQRQELNKEIEDRIMVEERLEAARELQDQAIQLNDEVVQGLSVAKMALEMGNEDLSRRALASTLESAKGIVGDLLEEAEADGRLEPGQLVHRHREIEPAPEAEPEKIS